MVQVTVPSELDLLQSTEDPIDIGDIRVIGTAPVSITGCETTVGWTFLHGTSEVNDVVSHIGTVYEGNASLKIQFYRGSTIVFKYNDPTTDYNLSGQGYLKVALYPQSISSSDNFTISFGESTYNEQNSTAFKRPLNQWTVHSYNISGIADADKNAVTSVGITYNPVTTAGILGILYIDAIKGYSGPSQVKAFDGDRVITMYPKVLHGLFTGNGTTDHTIFLSDTSDATVASRKGTPIHITVMGSTKSSSIEWSPIHNTTGGAWSFKHTAAAHEITAHGIVEVGEGYFVISSSNTNVNNDLYSFTALYAD